MNRVLRWLVWKLAHPFSIGPTDQRGPDGQERDVGKEDEPREPLMGSGTHSSIDELMPDIDGASTGDTQPDDDVLSDDDTQPVLEIIENPSPTDEISDGFDPYNSGDYRVPKK